MFTNTIFIVLGGGCLTFFGRLTAAVSLNCYYHCVTQIRGPGFRMIMQFVLHHITSIWWSWELGIHLFDLNTLDFEFLGILTE